MAGRSAYRITRLRYRSRSPTMRSSRRPRTLAERLLSGRGGAQGEDVAQDEVGDVRLRHAGQRARAAPAVEQQHLVLVGVEADPLLAYIVRDQQVDPLALELRTRVLGDVVGLRGEADDERAGAATGDLGEDVRVRRELEGQVALALDLGRGRVLGAVVRDGGRLDHDRGRAEMLEHRLAHVLGGLHGDEDRAGRGRELCGTRDQRYLRAAPERGGREAVAHLARRAVRDVAYRVDRLARRPRGDEEQLTRQVARGRQHTQERVDDRDGHGGPT